MPLHTLFTYNIQYYLQNLRYVATSYVLTVVMSSMLADIGLTLCPALLHFAWWEKSTEEGSVHPVKHYDTQASYMLVFALNTSWSASREANSYGQQYYSDLTTLFQEYNCKYKSWISSMCLLTVGLAEDKLMNFYLLSFVCCCIHPGVTTTLKHLIFYLHSPLMNSG